MRAFRSMQEWGTSGRPFRLSEAMGAAPFDKWIERRGVDRMLVGYLVGATLDKEQLELTR